jgi:hypothetical protein
MARFAIVIDSPSFKRAPMTGNDPEKPSTAGSAIAMPRFFIDQAAEEVSSRQQLPGLSAHNPSVLILLPGSKLEFFNCRHSESHLEPSKLNHPALRFDIVVATTIFGDSRIGSKTLHLWLFDSCGTVAITILLEGDLS